LNAIARARDESAQCLPRHPPSFELYSASYDLLIRMLKPDVDAVEPSLVF